jgi:hypothetical protein
LEIIRKWYTGPVQARECYVSFKLGAYLTTDSSHSMSCLTWSYETVEDMLIRAMKVPL